MTDEQKILELLKDLADVLEKHAGGLHYTKSDDGIHITQGIDFRRGVCIGFPLNGDVSEMRRIIQYLTAQDNQPTNQND
jgi:hypothetical protein